VTSSLAMFEAVILVNHLIKSCLKTRRKEKIWKKKKLISI